MLEDTPEGLSFQWRSSIDLYGLQSNAGNCNMSRENETPVGQGSRLYLSNYDAMNRGYSLPVVTEIDAIANCVPSVMT